MTIYLHEVDPLSAVPDPLIDPVIQSTVNQN
jgi:hypothetical protein